MSNIKCIILGYYTHLTKPCFVYSVIEDAKTSYKERYPHEYYLERGGKITSRITCNFDSN